MREQIVQIIAPKARERVFATQLLNAYEAADSIVALFAAEREAAKQELDEALKILDVAVSRGCDHCSDTIRRARAWLAKHGKG